MDIPYLSALVGILIIVLDISIRIIALGVIPNNRKPSEATAWLLAIIFVPFIGLFFFILFGHSKLSKKRRRKQRAINELIYQKTFNQHSIDTENAPPKWLLSLAKLNSNLGALPLVGGNDAELIEDYEKSLAEMARAIDGATKYVHVEFYIMSLDSTTKSFFKSIADAKKRGIMVRVILDHVGSLQYPDYKNTIEYFNKHNIDYQLALPIMPLKGKFQRPDLRNHRKLLVIDGHVGFMGSQNIIDSTYNKNKNRKKGLHWQELMVRVSGPIVAELDAVFIGDWYSETDELLEAHIPNISKKGKDLGDYDCQLVPSGPGFEHENNLKFFTSLMYAAQHKIIITSPYFVPDESMLTAITTAAQRGVAVELFVSEVGDQLLVYHAQRSYYEALLRAGVKIYMYSSPTVLHAKHFTVDDSVAVIGSSNMDMRSFNLNLEISMLVYSKDFVKNMRLVEDHYRNNSKELILDVWLRRPIKDKFVDNVARLTSSLQ